MSRQDNRQEKIRKVCDKLIRMFESGQAPAVIAKGNLKGGQCADQEIVAEMTAAVLSEIYGYRSYLGNSWQYIKSYSNNNPDKAIRNILQLLADVEKCVETILEVKEERKIA